ncbi:MAG: hypothetical protein M3335_02065 [Actinomycetota bacterium]|nr:hypothetical protein [Actinomycetota bacterium]
MSELKAIKRTPAGVALLAVLALLAGCGSSGDSTTGASGGDTTAASGKKRKQGKKDAKKPGNEPCTPRREAGKIKDPPRRVEEGEPAPFEIGKTKLKLEVLDVAFPKAIPIVFGERPAFKAPEGSMLVAVFYGLVNYGPGRVKPSEHLNSHLLLRAAGKQYPYAAELPCGIPITASWALSQDGDNPAEPLVPRSSTGTAVVFIVPKQEPGTNLSLVVPGQVGIGLRPPA